MWVSTIIWGLVLLVLLVMSISLAALGARRSHDEVVAVSFLPRIGFGRRRKIKELERRVARLQATLSHYSEVTRTGFRREVTWALALGMLALGFTLGVYREPIRQAVIGVAQTLGLARETADAAYHAYQEGRYPAALRLARPLADEGDARAQSILGLLYYHGQGVQQDFAAAATWLRKAAEQDDADAQSHLGVMFFQGQGVLQDKTEAMKWFRRAADLGDAEAQYNLGISYAKGEGGELDNVRAHMWFNLAAAHFPTSDISDRNAAAKERDLVAAKMSPQQIAEALRLAREWQPTIPD
jgi:TPR repeat protein